MFRRLPRRGGIFSSARSRSADTGSSARGRRSSCIVANYGGSRKANNCCGASPGTRRRPEADAFDARFRALGYKPVTRKGLKLYCHNEQQLGSRLERTVCNTPEELDFALLNGRYPGPAGLIGLSGIKFN